MRLEADPDDLYTTQADVYDLIYTSMKDYESEASGLLAQSWALLGHEPTSWLDVACGTGLHLSYLQGRIARLVGVDNSPSQLEHARRRLSVVELQHHDMRDFRLGERFDVVSCLFSSIGHMHTDDDYRGALESMADHLNDDGVLLVEPWIDRSHFQAGRLSVETGEDAHRTVVRVTHSDIHGDDAVLHMNFYLSEHGAVRCWKEDLYVRLMTVDEQLGLFEETFEDVTFETGGGGSGRGLFIARRPMR